MGEREIGERFGSPMRESDGRECVDPPYEWGPRHCERVV